MIPLSNVRSETGDLDWPSTHDLTDPSDGFDPTHVAQFYEDERFLCDAAGDFLAAGYKAGQPLLVVATQTRQEFIARSLQAAGVDVEGARRAGRLVALDARHTLTAIMDGPMPDRARFRSAVGGALERVSLAGPHPTVRAYGEMVDLLWREGNVAGAVRLEELWNELANTHAFSLLCAYDMTAFDDESHARDFAVICGQHGRVIPTERYTRCDNDAKLAEITRLQQRAQALEAEIASRAVLEAQLREALDAAEAANRAKSEFLAVMSHELRTPLNAIGGYVELVSMGVHGPVTDAQRDALGRVQRSQRHLLSLINDLLNLARIESGRVDYVLEEVPLAALLADVTSLIEPLFTAGRITCEVVAGAAGSRRPRAVLADREKLQQIVLNLLTNAIKFSPAGGRVTVEVGPCEGAPDMACVHVRDTGVGIPVGKRASIFEPFVQLGAGGPGAQPGVGLGLAISRDLARGMGGDLTVESAAGAGSTFTVTLPLAS